MWGDQQEAASAVCVAPPHARPLYWAQVGNAQEEVSLGHPNSQPKWDRPSPAGSSQMVPARPLWTGSLQMFWSQQRRICRVCFGKGRNMGRGPNHRTLPNIPKH